MYSLVTTADTHVYLKCAMRVNHKCSSYLLPTRKTVTVGGDGYVN